MTKDAQKKKIKEILDELTEIELEIHRSAAQLGQCIVNINECLKIDDIDAALLYYRVNCKLRLNYKFVKENLEEKESKIWEKIYEVY